jgi:hypothetical protein
LTILHNCVFTLSLKTFLYGLDIFNGCFIKLSNVIAKTLSQGKKLYSAFVDFEKCFDKLERSYIFIKLSQEKVSSRFVKAIQSMYMSVKAAIKYKNSVSNFFESNIGAKQGDPSSSLLFLYFVNDLVNNICFVPFFCKLLNIVQCL